MIFLTMESINKIWCVLNNVEFDLDTAVRILKSRYKSYQDCGIVSPEIESLWETATPITFSEIGRFDDIDKKRAAFGVFGISNLIKELNPESIDKQTLTKNICYIDESGKLQEKTINDTYELFMVNGKLLGLFEKELYFVKFYCTSTGKQYIAWVNFRYNDSKDAITAIATTFNTTVMPEAIDYIIRQGDCILVRIKDNYKNKNYKTYKRHLTKDEYLKKLKYES